jgi:hypothetical protein
LSRHRAQQRRFGKPPRVQITGKDSVEIRTVSYGGFKGSIVRKVAANRSASSLQKSLTAIKTALEKEQQ